MPNKLGKICPNNRLALVALLVSYYVWYYTIVVVAAEWLLREMETSNGTSKGIDGTFVDLKQVDRVRIRARVQGIQELYFETLGVNAINI